MNPIDSRRTRAGWAVYYGREHPWNAAAPAHGDDQSSYRAELLALTHTMATARVPTRIVSDCESVVKAAKKIMDNQTIEEAEDSDCWNIIRRSIEQKPDNFYQIEWVKAHLTIDQADKPTKHGTFTADYINRNNAVDDDAKRAAKMHHVNHDMFALADNKAVIATLAQRMQVSIWAEVLPTQSEDHQNHSNPNADVQPPSEAEEDSDPFNPLNQSADHTPKDIARALATQVPQFPWQLEDEEYAHRIVLNPVPVHVHVGTRTQTVIPGRGTVNTSISFPIRYVEPAAWWFNQLRWTPFWTERPQERPPLQYQTTYLELAVDFEIAIGLNLRRDGHGANDWASKAELIAIIIKALVRIHHIKLDGIPANLKNALDPKIGVASLTPFGAARFSGLSRRPRWVANTTNQVVTANAWRAIQEYHKKHPNGTGPRLGCRHFPNGWKITRQSLPEKAHWVSEAEVALQEQTQNTTNSKPIKILSVDLTQKGKQMTQDLNILIQHRQAGDIHLGTQTPNDQRNSTNQAFSIDNHTSTIQPNNTDKILNSSTDTSKSLDKPNFQTFYKGGAQASTDTYQLYVEEKEQEVTEDQNHNDIPNDGQSLDHVSGPWTREQKANNECTEQHLDSALGADTVGPGVPRIHEFDRFKNTFRCQCGKTAKLVTFRTTGERVSCFDLPAFTPICGACHARMNVRFPRRASRHVPTLDGPISTCSDAAAASG